ncbi:restriction endonuclease subunit S [Aliikangiella sp. IMCC44359]|uniref:restriction endonuclease subunit S n=1 Tax=Aliikangiella sp. IMCC44359 TaxID=3459125 RepID=UPI00403B1EE0
MSWPLIKLSELFDVARGGSPRPIGQYLTSESNGINWIMIGDTIEGSKYIESTKKKIKPEGLSKTRQVYRGDFVLSNSMSFGRPYILNISGCIHDGWLVLSPKDERVNKDYLYYCLSSDFMYQQLAAKAAGAVVKNINTGIVKDTKIPLPPLPIQKQIAAVLEKADKLRQQCQQMEQELNQLAQSVFLDMFGEPVSNPKYINEVEFSEVYEIKSKLVSPLLDEFKNFLHIGPEHIEKSTGKIKPLLSAKDEGLTSGKFLFDKESVLYSKIRPYLKKAAIPEFVGLCSADMYPINPIKGKTTKEFIWALLMSPCFDQYIKTLPSRANIPKLNRTELAAFKFNLPPYSVQESFSKLLHNIRLKSFELAQYTEKCDQLFNSLMQRAFKGKLNLKQLENVA